MTQLYARDYEAARRQLLKALELNPNDADVLAHVAVGMALIGEQIWRWRPAGSALRLAPHRPEWHAAFVGEALFAARLHEEAIATMAPAPEALCNTPAFIAASPRPPRPGGAVRRPPGDGLVATTAASSRAGCSRSGMSCVDWLLAMDPFQHSADLEHYRAGLRKAGFA